MKVYLTSSPGGSKIENGRFVPDRFDETNDFVLNLKKDLKESFSCLMMAAYPEEDIENDNRKNDMKKAFEISGFSCSKIEICDNRNSEIADKLNEYDLIILCGGHVPTENAFFTKIGLKEKIARYKGVVIGISAGTMNCAEEVYAMPELNNEAIDENFKRFIPGLGLTDIQVVPHFQYIRNDVLDGLKLIEDIAFSDSKGKKFYALVDGSYITVENGKSVLYGEAYVIEDGKMDKISKKGDIISL